MNLRKAVTFAQHDAESRLYMLPVNCDPLERAIIEAQVKIYSEALESAGGSPAIVGELLAAAKAVLAREVEITQGAGYLEYRSLEAAILKAEGRA